MKLSKHTEFAQCPICGKTFERNKKGHKFRGTRLVKPCHSLTCSKKCSKKWMWGGKK